MKIKWISVKIEKEIKKDSHMADLDWRNERQATSEVSEVLVIINRISSRLNYLSLP